MQTLAFFGFPGHIELIIFLVIVLIFFGKRLPSAMFSVGKSITELKKGMHEGLHEDDDEPAKPKSIDKNAD
ncbi:MAG: twin-arginine translocase TatA/TatE family subunit [Planctomycetaceae bacterium]|nr:twin-arginine translocase TatA/TatE family subunit [Planctomycetaceae bacterium]